MSSVVWFREENKCIDNHARTVLVPPVGESERVPLMDVLRWKAWFPVGGIYILRYGEVVTYVGLTTQPLGARLRGALANRKTWTRADYREWTVTMQMAPSTYPDDIRRERELIAELTPVFNTLGRPRKNPVLA